MTIRVGINGFGRIGKCVLRVLIDTDGFEPVIINDLAPASQLAPLLKYDSVHGTFGHDIEGGDDWISVDGQKIPVTSIRNPEEVPWDGCDVVMECTGLFRDRETGSTWNLLGEAEEGPLAGRKLRSLAHGNHFWFAWVAFRPDTEVVER